MEIINQVVGKHNFTKILDRREAIKEALRSAESGDVVVITGKGAEPWIVGPRGEKTAWDDRAVVREESRGL
jgi:UDP-N-acetylmuramoyl-L-alanyl-D-glutamate--2,6-diaminopimelate ligase